MNRVTAVVVVHDPGCGSCAGIAERLRAVLRHPVLVRSCRDPALSEAYPRLRGLGCTVPALGTVRADGSVRWWIGAGAAAIGGLGSVRPGRLPVAVAVLLSTIRTQRSG